MKNLVPKIILTIFIGLMTISTAFCGGYNVGDMAKSFTLKNVDGNMVSLSDYKEAKGLSSFSHATIVLMPNSTSKGLLTCTRNTPQKATR